MRDLCTRITVGTAIALPLCMAAAFAISVTPETGAPSPELSRQGQSSVAAIRDAVDLRATPGSGAELSLVSASSACEACAKGTCESGQCETLTVAESESPGTCSTASDETLIALARVGDDDDQSKLAAEELAKLLGSEHPLTLAAQKREKAAGDEKSAGDEKPAEATRSVPALKLVPAQKSTSAIRATVVREAAPASSAAGDDVDVTETPKRESGKEFVPTHKQVRVIKPTHDGQSITLNTFCLDTQGNIVACVGGSNAAVVVSDDGTLTAEVTDADAFVQIYSPDGELLRETDMPFKPTAVNVASDGMIYVAGTGKMARISADGELLVVTSTPNIGDLDEFRRKVEEDAKKQKEQYLAQFSVQLNRIESQLAKLEETPEADRPQNYELRVKTLKSQQQIYQQQLKAVESQTATMFDTNYAMQRKLGVTGLAVTDNDVFISLSAIQGYGYEVWRTDREFSSPEMIVDGLSGCCGQFDIQATDEKLLLAENGKFRVSVRDREGALLTSFGSRDQTGKEGFGSCCNPMNVRCCSNGDVLTAESSIGTIKRFSADGELVGVVGKAKIGGGCKHVAIGFDEKRDRYYMMNVTAGHICVMLPLSEAPAMTEDELLAKTARDGLGRQLVGEWVDEGFSKKRTNSGVRRSALGGLLGALLGSDEPAAEETSVVITGGRQQPFRYVFEDDQKLTVEGGVFANSNMQWEAIREVDESTLEISELIDLVEYETIRIEFLEPNKARISAMYGETPTSTGIYIRNESGNGNTGSKPVEPKAAEAVEVNPEVKSEAGEAPVEVPSKKAAE